MGYTRKISNRGGLDIYTFLNGPLVFFRFVNLLLAKKLLRLQILPNCVTLPQCFHPIFFPWLSLAFWDSSSLTFADFNQGWIIRFYRFFLSLNPRSLKEIHGERILLTMYVYHNAAFTFEASFSTSIYDARWMCFNFTPLHTSWWT